MSKSEPTLTREQAEKTLASGSAEHRRVIAGDSNVEPEILYYLSGDEDASVRQTVAANPAAPYQADRALSEDPDDEVRIELTRKIARMLPGIDEDGAKEVWRQTVEILAILAEDQLTRVRQILAEELKQSDRIPHAVVRRLAEDTEEVVSAPILEYSPLLSERDLKEIIAAGLARGALLAVTRREGLSEELADIVVASLEIPAISELLANKEARIREATMNAIVRRVEDVPELHEPLAMRPNLSVRIIKRIAGFVASSLVNTMIEQNELPDDVASDIVGRVRRRIETDGDVSIEDDMIARLPEMQGRGLLNDEFVTEGIKARRRSVVIHALAMMAGAKTDAVASLLASKNGRAVAALAWRAGLSMRTALAMQTDLAYIPPDRYLSARNGVDYPLSPAELEREASFFLD